MKRISLFILATGLVFCTTFAQKTSSKPVAKTETGTFPLPERNDVSGAFLRSIMDTVAGIQSSGPDSRTENLFAALDKVETMAQYVETDTLAKCLYVFAKAQICQNLADEYIASNNKDSAILWAKDAVKYYEAYLGNRIGPAGAAYAGLSAIYLNILNNAHQGLLYLDKLIAADPANSANYLMKSRVLMDLGRTNEGCDALKKAKALGALVDGPLNFYGCHN